MTSALIHIGLSGVSATRASLELTAQNIANAGNDKYARRTLSQSELVASSTMGLQESNAYGGVTHGAVSRSQNELLQLQMRRSSADLSAAGAELSALQGVETALEQSRLFEGLTSFEAALLRLEGDPANATLRTAALESARAVTGSFRLATAAHTEASGAIALEASAAVDNVNALAQRLGEINVSLRGSREGSGSRAALLDARDAALRDLSGEARIAVEFDRFGAARVTLAGTPDALLLEGANAAPLSYSQGNDGRLSYQLGGVAFIPASGAMAGRVSALDAIANARAELDALAAQVINIGNDSQAAGSALDGSPGQPLFSGSNATDIGIAQASGSGLATAAAGSPPGSRDTSNLGNLIAALGAPGGPAAGTDRLLLGLSTRIAALDTRREGLAVVAQGAQTALNAETGVDLDTEAAALVRLQQAFEANSRVIQVATRIFDTILGLQ